MGKWNIALEKNVYDDWCTLQKSLGLDSDEQFANILLQQYKNLQAGMLAPPVFCIHCHGPLSLFCASCKRHAELGTSHENHEDMEMETQEAFANKMTPDKKSEISRQLNSSSDINIVKVESEHSRSPDIHSVDQDKIKEEDLADESSVAKFNDNKDTNESSNHQSGGDVNEKLHADPFSMVFVCQKCTRAFSCSLSLKRHERQCCKSTGKPPDCSLCGESFKTFILYQNHMKTSHGVTHPFQCDKCDKTFTSRHNLTTHLDRCPYAQKTSERPQVVNDTAVTAGGKSAAISVPSNGNGKNSSKYTVKFGMHLCNSCGKRFIRKDFLEKHILRMHTKGASKPFFCTDCGSGFLSNSELERHLKRHTGERTFICDICSAAFIDKGGLTRHMKIHAVNREMCICEVCGSSFTDRHNLNIHKYIHSGERPYKCSFCDATFRQSSILRKHERKHKGERKFICTECGRGFTENEYLKSHMRIHTGERPFVCDICGAGFAQKGSLNSHRRTHKVVSVNIPVGADVSIR